MMIMRKSVFYFLIKIKGACAYFFPRHLRTARIADSIERYFFSAKIGQFRDTFARKSVLEVWCDVLIHVGSSVYDRILFSTIGNPLFNTPSIR